MIDVCDDVGGQRNVINLNEEEKIWDKDDLHLLLPLTILPNWSSRSSHSILKSLREHLPNSTHSHSIALPMMVIRLLWFLCVMEMWMTSVDGGGGGHQLTSRTWSRSSFDISVGPKTGPEAQRATHTTHSKYHRVPKLKASSPQYVLHVASSMPQRRLIIQNIQW